MTSFRHIARHINKLRFAVLITVFLMLVLLPFLSIYQNYVSAHAYDLLASGEKSLYDTMEFITSPFTNDPAKDLNNIKGTTWSGTFFGLQLSDPLAVVTQIAAARNVYWPFLLTAIIPIILTIVIGRFFCGWICPATLIYELNDTLRGWLQKLGFNLNDWNIDKRIKYFVLLAGLVLAVITGTVTTAAIYPPAILGREIYYAIALGGFGVGMVFFLVTLLADLFVARRSFCRYLCPGGALYSLLGHFRLLRIEREVENCNDCTKCNVVCQFGLDPMRDDFTQECNNCTACIAVCPTDALLFTINISDQKNQGPGHLGHDFKHQKQDDNKPISSQEVA